MINVLYVTFASENFDGATYSLMDLIRSVRHSIYPIVMVRTKGCVYDYFIQNGVECIVCDFEEDLVGKPVKIHQYIKYTIDYIPHRIRYDRANHRCVQYIAEQLKDRDIRIVHINNTVMSVGREIALRLHAKCVWHLRGFMDLDFGWMPLQGWKTYKQKILNTDAVIGITKTVLKHFISPDNSNAYHVFDAVRSKNDTCLILPKEKYFLFCAGLLSKQKGCDFAIQAFAKSGLAKLGYSLRIIGESNPNYMKELKRIIQENNIEQAIDFIGRTENVKDHMSKATAFLMCSENEGLGRVSVEAMFYGCLVIGRNSGGTKDFIFNGKTGLLFDDIDGCVNAMKKAVEDKGIIDIINNAQSFASSNFSIEDYGEKILSIYSNILFKQ